ncbi:hypothetical protein ACROYT_G024963 [Oculina patagonica]
MMLPFALLLVWISHVASGNKHSQQDIAWIKYSESPSWCTASGRTLISFDVECPIDHKECQKRCNDRPGCHAIEFWENYNYACYECKDSSFVKPYTDASDEANPVHVWIKVKVEWEAEGCYKEEGEKVLTERFATHKKIKDYKKVFDFCKERANQESFDVFGIGTKDMHNKGNKQRFVCLTTKDGKQSGKYGRNDKDGCKVEDAFGVGVKHKVNYVYTRFLAGEYRGKRSLVHLPPKIKTSNKQAKVDE